jgi:hypothetical protein
LKFENVSSTLRMSLAVIFRQCLSSLHLCVIELLLDGVHLDVFVQEVDLLEGLETDAARELLSCRAKND